MSEKKIEIKINNNPLDELINDINSSVFSKEKWVDNEFYKIPEITYSYEAIGKNNIVNKTLFVELGDLNIKEFIDSDYNQKKSLINKAGNTVRSKILEKKYKIENFLKQINKIDGGDNEVLIARKEIIEGGLNENIIFLDIALEGLGFEKEKAMLGLYFDGEDKRDSDFYIKKEKREEKLQKINHFNTQIFGEKISNNVEYIEGSLDYLFGKFQEYNKEKEKGEIEEKRLLSEDEEKRYNNYIAKLQGLKPDYKAKIRTKPKSVIDSKFKEIKIDIESVKDNMNHGLTATRKQNQNMPHEAYFDDDISGFTDTHRGTGIPKNNSLKYKTVFDVIKLIGHESEQHGVSQVSHEELVGNIRGKQNLEVVEGAAMLWEELFEYGENMYIDGVDINGNPVKVIDLEKISYVQSFPKTMMEEILTDEEFYDFLRLQNKIEPDKMSPLNRYLRFKRTGFQRKDITYTTGKLKAAKYYNAIITGEIDGDFSDLYLGKVGYTDIDNIKILKKSIDDSNKIDEFKKIKLPENLFFAEAAYFGVLQKENGEDINGELFYDYLNNKYPSLNVTQEKINSIGFGFKKQLLGIVNNIFFEVDVYNERKKNKQKSNNILKAQ